MERPFTNYTFICLVLEDAVKNIHPVNDGFTRFSFSGNRTMRKKVFAKADLEELEKSNT